MKALIPCSFLATLAASGLALGAETAYTAPVGYVSQTALSGSDTIVGVPLRLAAAAAGALSGSPDLGTIAGSAILSISGTPAYTVNGFQNTHYVKFKTGAAAGNVFAITANTDATVTVDLNGSSLTAATSDTLEIIKFWTLSELFNPAIATNDPLTTPHAIVSSAGTSPAARRTEVVIPDLAGVGSNLAPNKNFYINAGIWKQVGQGATSFNNFQLWPDTHFIIRNPTTVTSSTTFTSSGEVDQNKMIINLATSATVKQDNYVALTRPVDVTLNQLTLGGTPAFVTSTSSAPAGRRDEILVYNNAAAGINKSPSANYYYFNAAWRKVGQAATIDAGLDVIPAGSGIIVRKYQVSGGATAAWENLPNY